ncbi:MAG TPA: rod shape-determining protein [Candidatus Binatia bacterium]|nr:rod shape-determining protein [Candidatus Binatia bacterium]
MRRQRASADLYVDLGTANTLVCAPGAGVVLDEPSVIALREDAAGRPTVLAIGAHAAQMAERAPQAVSVVRPLRDGVVVHVEAASLMVRAFARRCRHGVLRRRPRLVVSLPHDVTAVEREAVREVALATGARDVTLIDEPIAAALGAELPVLEPHASMVVDVGSGTTEVAVISLAGIVHCESVRLGGDAMDAAIARMIRRRYGLLVGQPTAEQAKITLGADPARAPARTVRVRGRDVTTGLPRAVAVTSEDVCEALGGILDRIARAVRAALEATPADLAADIGDGGIVLTGGGALLRGLPRRLAWETRLPVHVAAAPLQAVARGGAVMLENERVLELVARG